MTGRGPSRGILACAVLIALLAVGSIVLGLRSGAGGTPPSNVKPSARATLSSRTILFGDTVEARLDLVVPRSMAGTSFSGHPNFLPFQIVSRRVARTALGDGLERISLIYGIACLTQRCVGSGPGTKVQFSPASISIPGGTVRATWPTLVEVSRTTGLKFPVTDGLTAGQVDFPWLHPLDAIDEALAAAGIALVLLLGSWLYVRRRVRLRAEAAAKQASMLQILLARVEAGLPEDVLYQQRHALDALAVELRHRHIDGSLDVDAERLAWSPEDPDPAEVRALLAEVRRRAEK
jgi:hypothetical protein